MKFFKRIVKYAAALAGLGFIGLLTLFCLYGFSQGHRVGSGLAHLFEFRADPVEDNPPLEDIAWHRVSWLADIENLDLSESSGLTASNLHHNVVWSINDSGNGPQIFAIGLDGKDLGAWLVDTADPEDWESMDSFVLDGVAYLVIGDTGDNLRWRSEVSFLVVPEPTDLRLTDTALAVAWQVRFTYPDGPRDSEALAVDPHNKLVYVLSKRHYPAELFRVALRSPDLLQAEKLAELELPRPITQEMEEGSSVAFRYTPTGMDLAENRLFVTTYRHAFLYQLNAIDDPPLRVPLPTIGQREALTFAKDRSDLAFISRERARGLGIADLFMIELPPVQTSAGKLGAVPQAAR